jgi:hypothetical protein
MGQHPTKVQLQYPNLLQSVSLPCPQLDRAVLQQDQTVSEKSLLVTASSRLTTSRSSSCVNKAMAGANEYSA